ncbi:hypothetical protein JMJ35_006846 [Cladonia borealis]|uniref:Uncharacterized protein n=1 Tax=Cladonia borealis TaxID=184061 RepID=A0AA39QY23_9LECA|nr:hypothetical protein JMJ35_006846 [Cladonia borealis]
MALAAALARARKADSTTWFLLGACVQLVLALCLPIYVSFVPIATVLLTHSLKTAVQSTRPTLAKSTSIPDDVLQGRYTAQIPHKDGSSVQQGAGEESVVFVLGASSHRSVQHRRNVQE